MTSTRWRTAAHGATGRLRSRFAGNARLGAAASVGCPEQEPRLRTAAVESAWFLKTLARTKAGRISFAKPVPQSASRGELFLANVPEGPNAAHPVTQTVSHTYLRFETGNGKLVAEKLHKLQGGGASLSSD